MRRDPPGSLIHAGDLDNRIKTLLGGLRKPSNPREVPDNTAPCADEEPFFTLLDDRRLVTAISIDTDTLLDPVLPEEDHRRVRAVITVDVRATRLTYLNLEMS